MDRWSYEAIPARRKRKPAPPPVTLVRGGVGVGEDVWTRFEDLPADESSTQTVLASPVVAPTQIGPTPQDPAYFPSKWAEWLQAGGSGNQQEFLTHVERTGGWTPDTWAAQSAASPALYKSEIGTPPVASSTPAAMQPVKQGTYPTYNTLFGFNQAYTNPWPGGPPRHRGIDLVVPGKEQGGRGTPVQAFQEGKVVAAGPMDWPSGNGIIIQMPNGLYTRYFHLDRVDVKPGDTIRAGQSIGVQGGTGTEESPHLHFEVSKGVNGDPTDQLIDPTPYIPGFGQVGQGEDAPQREYASTQMNLPEDAAKHVRALAGQIPSDALHGDGREDQPHVTVLYGIHDDNPDAAAAAAWGHQTVLAKLGPIRSFPDSGSKEYPQGDVVHIQVEAPDLHQMRGRLAQALPNTQTHPDYKPHITLAYVKPGTGPQYEADTHPLLGKTIPLDTLTFSHKTGEQSHIPLGGSVGRGEDRWYNDPTTVMSDQAPLEPTEEGPAVNDQIQQAIDDWNQKKQAGEVQQDPATGGLVPTAGEDAGTPPPPPVPASLQPEVRASDDLSQPANFNPLEAIGQAAQGAGNFIGSAVDTGVKAYDQLMQQAPPTEPGFYGANQRTGQESTFGQRNEEVRSLGRQAIDTFDELSGAKASREAWDKLQEIDNRAADQGARLGSLDPTWREQNPDLAEQADEASRTLALGVVANQAPARLAEHPDPIVRRGAQAIKTSVESTNVDLQGLDSVGQKLIRAFTDQLTAAGQVQERAFKNLGLKSGDAALDDVAVRMRAALDGSREADLIVQDTLAPALRGASDIAIDRAQNIVQHEKNIAAATSAGEKTLAELTAEGMHIPAGIRNERNGLLRRLERTDQTTGEKIGLRPTLDQWTTYQDEIRAKIRDAVQRGANDEADIYRNTYSIVEDNIVGVQKRIKRVEQLLSRIDSDIADRNIKFQDQTREKARRIMESRLGPGGMTLYDSEHSLDVIRSELAANPELGAEVDRITSAFWKANDMLRDRMVEAGVWSPEAVDAMRRLYPKYVPTQYMHHLSADGSQVGVAARSILPGKNTGVHGITIEGSEQDAMSGLHTTLDNIYRMTNLARRNETFMAFDKAIQADPTGFGTIARRLPDISAEALDGLSAAEKAKIRGEHAALVRESQKADMGLISGHVDGNLVQYVAPKAFSELFAVAGKGSPNVFQTVLEMNRKIVQMATISRNPIRLPYSAVADALSYAINAGAQDFNPKTLGGSVGLIPRLGAYLAQGYWDAFQGFLHGEYTGEGTQQFLRGGGGMSGLTERTGANWHEKTIEDMRRSGYNVLDPRRGGVKSFIKDATTLAWVESILERFELAPRVAAMRMAEASGKTPLESIIAGRRVTVDFAQGGTLAKQASMAIPFFNPVVQSAATAGRVMTENKAGYMAMMAAGIVTPAAAAHWWNRSDPGRSLAYDGLPDYVKDAGVVWMLPTKGEDELGGTRYEAFVVPLREYAPFAAAVRRGLDQMNGRNPGAWDSFAADALQNLSPVRGDMSGLSGMFGGAVGTLGSLAVNSDTLSGREINTPDNDKRAGAVAKLLAKYVPTLSASQWEYALKQTAGGPGQVYGAAANYALDPEERRRSTAGRPQDLPIIGGPLSKFVKDTGQAPSQADVAENLPLAERGQFDKLERARTAIEKQRPSYEQERAAVLGNRDLTHQQQMDQLKAVDDKWKSAQQALYSQQGIENADEFQKSLTAAQAAHPDRAKVYGGANLPEGFDIQTVLGEYQHPPTNKPWELMDDQDRKQAQSNWIEKKARELKIDPNALRDYLRNAEAGKPSLPNLDMSEADFAKAVDKFMNPGPLVDPKTGETIDYKKRGVDPNGNPIEYEDAAIKKAARDAELSRAAQAAGISYDAMKARVEARLAGQDKTEPERSMDKAFELSAKVQDPQNFPRYVFRDASGQKKPITDAEQVARLDAYQKAHAGESRNPQLLAIKDAQGLADAERYLALWRSPDFQDYDRWFGSGRSLTEQDWTKQRQTPHYQGVTDPRQSEQWDRALKLAALLPRTDPRYAQVYATAYLARKLMDPRAKAQIEYDEINRRSLAGQFAALDAALNERSNIGAP